MLEIRLESYELPGAARSRVLELSPRAQSSDKNLEKSPESPEILEVSGSLSLSLQEGLYALQLEDLNLNTLEEIILLYELTG